MDTGGSLGAGLVWVAGFSVASILDLTAVVWFSLGLTSSVVASGRAVLDADALVLALLRWCRAATLILFLGRFHWA